MMHVCPDGLSGGKRFFTRYCPLLPVIDIHNHPTWMQRYLARCRAALLFTLPVPTARSSSATASPV